MKKILALLLAVVMIASLFVGCNTSTTSPTNPSEPSNETPTDQAETPTDETPAPTENNGDVVTVKWVAVGNGMPPTTMLGRPTWTSIWKRRSACTWRWKL